jgi:glycosyltransferase involved in cell wall biosynthesis
VTADTIPVSVIIPVKNEEANLVRCLSKLKRFQEVIVVDSCSTDRTPQIAAAHGAQLITFQWDGRFPKKRNWVLLHHKLACEWVLFLDADEFVTEAFVNAVARAVQNGKKQGYWLNYTNYFLGKPLRFGVPQRKLALFQVGAGLYERIDEEAWSQLDMEVHEHPVIEGLVSEIREPIDPWEARRTLALRTGPTGAWKDLTGRQRFKYKNIDRWWYPPFYFAVQYFAKLGILDGEAGLQYAFYKFWYFNTVRLLIRKRVSFI